MVETREKKNSPVIAHQRVVALLFFASPSPGEPKTFRTFFPLSRQLPGYGWYNCRTSVRWTLTVDRSMSMVKK